MTTGAEGGEVGAQKDAEESEKATPKVEEVEPKVVKNPWAKNVSSEAASGNVKVGGVMSWPSLSDAKNKEALQDLVDIYGRLERPVDRDAATQIYWLEKLVETGDSQAAVQVAGMYLFVTKGEAGAREST